MALPSDQTRRTLMICLGLAVATFVTFESVRHFEFTNYDDNYYIYENHIVSSGLNRASILWALTTTWFSYWHPLTWLSHAFDCQLFGLRPGAHHLISLSWHALNTVCLFLALQRITKATARSAVVAALFALHPMHVESVAWCSERKDLLSTFFWILTIWTYASYAQRPKAGSYILSLVFCAAGLMSKPMVVTLPCVLLLLDYWPLRRISWARRTSGSLEIPLRTWRQLLVEKIPFFLLAGATSLIAYFGTKAGGSILSAEALPWSFRLTNVPISYARYLGKLLFPDNMTVLYPIPPNYWEIWQVGGATVLLVIICLAVAAFAQTRGYLVTGWLWFLGTLVPTLSLVAVGFQSLADRYTYLSYIGLFILLVWSVADIVRGPQRDLVLKAVTAVALLLCVLGTQRQLRYWRNSLALWSHAVAVTKDNAIAQYNLGHVLQHGGNGALAAEHYREALRINPDHVDANLNLAILSRAAGRPAEATNLLARALKGRPDYDKAHMNMGIALFELGDVAEATNHLAAAVRFGPKNAEASYNYAEALLSLGQATNAVAQFEQALRLDRGYATAHNGLARAYLALLKFPEAKREIDASLQIDPNNVEAKLILGTILLGEGRADDAIAQFRRIIEAQPELAEAHYRLGTAYGVKKQTDLEAQQYRASLRLDPESLDALNSLAWLLATSNRSEIRNGSEAISLAERACQLTSFGKPEVLATLAAAQAEAGKLTEANETIQRALKLAESQGLIDVKAKVGQMAVQLAQEKPWREP